MRLQLREYSSMRWTSHSVRSGSCADEELRELAVDDRSWIVGSVGPGASPMPTMPSSVRISTIRPEADSRMPPVHFSGSRMDVRTAVVVTLVIRTGVRLD